MKYYRSKARPKVGDQVKLQLLQQELFGEVDKQGKTWIIRVGSRVFNTASKAIKKITKL